jgi:hypothetical protein
MLSDTPLLFSLLKIFATLIHYCHAGFLFRCHYFDAFAAADAITLLIIFAAVTPAPPLFRRHISSPLR